MKGGEAAHVLQVEGDEEEKAGEAGEGADAEERCAEEGQAAEEAQVDQRIAAARLIEDEGQDASAAVAKRPRISAELQPACGPSMRPQVSVESADDDERLTDGVEGAGAGGFRLWHETRGEERLR